MEREVYTVSDMQQILGGASYSVACRKIREVKSISNRLDIRGLIHKKDWEDYLDYRAQFSKCRWNLMKKFNKKTAKHSNCSAAKENGYENELSHQ